MIIIPTKHNGLNPILHINNKIWMLHKLLRFWDFSAKTNLFCGHTVYSHICRDRVVKLECNECVYECC